MMKSQHFISNILEIALIVSVLLVINFYWKPNANIHNIIYVSAPILVGVLVGFTYSDKKFIHLLITSILASIILHSFAMKEAYNDYLVPTHGLNMDVAHLLREDAMLLSIGYMILIACGRITGHKIKNKYVGSDLSLSNSNEYDFSLTKLGTYISPERLNLITALLTLVSALIGLWLTYMGIHSRTQ